MALVHFKGTYSAKTACGRRIGQSTDHKEEVTCPRCMDKLRRPDAYGATGDYHIEDDMVGTAKIRRVESPKKKRLIETLEVMIAVPDVTHGIAVENMISQWGGTPYAELSVLLVKLRHLAMIHQTHHWTAKGDPFYGDHLLYERLYNTVVEEIDALAEKSVGLGGEDNVNLQLQAMQLAQLTKEYGTAVTLPVASNLPQRSMAAEVDFLRCVAQCACTLKEKGMLTRGLDNFLQGMEDKHESHVYLLKRRLGAGIQTAAAPAPKNPSEHLSEKRVVKRPAKKAAPKKIPPSSLMKMITGAFHTLGYVVGSREKTMGAMKAWMDLPKHLRPKKPQEPDTSLMSDEEFEKYQAAKDAEYDARVAAQANEPAPKAKSPGQIAMKFRKALHDAGLETTVSGDHYETRISGKGFDVTLPPEGGGDIGADIYIAVYAGKYADEERSGIDTTDYMYGEGRLRETVEMPEAELASVIATMDPDQIADDDYIDSDTGEIHLEMGRPARTSRLHPEYERDAAAKYAAKKAEWDRQEAEWAKEDEEWEAEKARSREESQTAYDAALREFAGNWTDFEASMGDEYSDDIGQSAAMDAAAGFFHQFPEWKRWAADLDMSKADIQSAVADFVYEAILTHKIDF